MEFQKTTTGASSRIAYWDNLRAVLIFLVVLGHFLLPVHARGRSVASTCNWIYMFHMPAFVFVSGCFSKSFAKKPNVTKLFGILLLYFLFQTSIWALNCLMEKQVSELRLFATIGAPWYLFSLFVWYLLIPYCSRIRPTITIPCSIIIAVLLGAEPNVNSCFGASLFPAFFPFFLLGFLFQQKWIVHIKTWMRIISASFLMLVLIVLFVFGSAIGPYLFVMYGVTPYASHSLTLFSGALVRLIWYLVASACICAVLCLVPNRKNFFTYIGERTLSIYILHVLLRNALLHFGIYNYLGRGFKLLLLCVIISVIVTLVLSEKHLSMFINKALRLNWGNKRKDGHPVF